MKEINVIISKWENGSGNSYSTDIDPMHIDEDQDIMQGARNYVEMWLSNDESMMADLEQGDDYKFTFRADEEEINLWASDIVGMEN